MIKTLIALLFTTVASFGAMPTLSIETLGAIKNPNITDKAHYGAGLDVGAKFNKFVTGHVRAISYSDQDWRGSAVDEGSLLVEARLLGSESGKLTLSAIGGADRDFALDDWGFSVGARGAVQLTKNFGLFGESRIRAWFHEEKDLITSAGLAFTF